MLKIDVFVWLTVNCTGKICVFYSELLTHKTVDLIEKGLLFPEKILGLWLEFGFFGS